MSILLILLIALLTKAEQEMVTKFYYHKIVKFIDLIGMKNCRYGE